MKKVKYEDVLKEIEGMTYTPVSQRKNTTSKINSVGKNNIKEEETIKSSSFSNPYYKTPAIPTYNDVNTMMESYEKPQVDTSKIPTSMDLIKRAGATIGDLSSDFITGFGGAWEGMADLGAAGLKAAGKLTSKIVDNPVGKFIFGEDAANYENNPLWQIGNDMTSTDVAKTVGEIGHKTFEENSKADNIPYAREISQGVGQVVGDISVGNAMGFKEILPTSTNSKVFNSIAKGLNQPSLQAMFLGVAGNSYTEALKDGASEADALAYGALNGVKETATELMYGGLGSAFGKGALDDTVKDLLTDRIKNKVAKKATKLGIGMVAEGLEEVAATILDPFVKSVYTKKLDFSSYDTMLDDFVVGALTSGVMQGGEALINKTRNNAQNNKKTAELENKGAEIGTKETTQGTKANIPINNTQNLEINENKVNAPIIQSDLNEQITQMRKNDINLPQISNQISELETKVNNLSDNSATFAQDNKTLEQRVSGDELLDAQDLIEELKSVGASVDSNGYVRLYHQTTNENAEKIRNTGKMISNEQDIFFSTSKNASQSDGRGTEKLEFNIPAEKLILDDLFDDNADVKIPLKGQKELDISNYIVKNEDNSLKTKQMDIINNSNPMLDDYHTGIRNVNDIKTLEETLNDSDYIEYDEFNPDLTRQDIENAIKKGTITVYSSYPIENGVFVSPSKMEAESYSGNGKVYSKEVPIQDVAWIDPTQGQYAKVNNNSNENIKNYSNASNSSFDEQIDLLINNQWNKNASLILFKETPKLYQDLGLSNKEITASPSKMKEIIYGNKNHIGIGVDNAKALPEAISNPLNIIESTTRDNSIVAVTKLADANDNIIVAALQIDGFGNIELIDANDNSYINTKTTNVLLSSYGKDAYDKWMEKHKDKIIYDTDEGIIKKRVNGKWVQSPNAINSSVNNITTNDSKSQIAIPSKYNMQQEQKNIPIRKDIPKNPTKESSYDVLKKTRKELNGNFAYDLDNFNEKKGLVLDEKTSSIMADKSADESFTTNNMPQSNKNVKPSILTKEKNSNKKNTIPMVINDNVLKVESKRIADQINKSGGFDLKQRSWIETSTESESLKGKILIEDLPTSALTYVVQSNKSSVDKANNKINNLGYDGAVDYAKQLLNSDKLPSATDVALLQRMIQEATKQGDYETAQELIMDTAILGTDLGQATQALSIIQKLTPEGQLKMYTKLVQRAKSRGEKSFQNVEITPEMVETILEAYNNDGTFDQEDLNSRVEKFKQDIADQMKATVGEKVDAWRYLSMLGNPKTHIRNMVSNVAMTGTIKVKNALARTLETALPIKTRTKTWKKASQTVQDYAKQTAIDMKGIITGEAKYNEKTSIESKKQIFKNKALEKVSNFNSNALEAEDWFFSKRAFQSTFQEYLTANGIETEADIKNNPEIIEKAKIYAVEQAEIATFRQYSKLASMINQFERKSKVGKFALEATMPFKKTPINVAKAGVNYSPIGLIKAISYDAYQLKQGNIEASQFIDKLSQGITGTSLTLLGYALAKAGILHGSGDDDKEGKYDSQLGNSGYSVKIGDNSYSISWLSPVAMPLLVGANAYEQLEEEKEWDMNVVSDTLAKTLDPLNEMSFMQGLTNALQSYGGGADKIKGSLESVGQNYAGQFFPTLFSQIASTTDDKKRSTKASNNSSYKFGEQTLRSIMYKVPGLRQQLEVATDIWGNEKEQSDNILERAFESFIAPYSKTNNISTALDKELKKVYNETDETGVIPSIPYAYVKYGNNTYRMSASEYTQYKKTYGQTAYKLLNKTIESKNYKSLSYEEKAKVLKNVFGYSKYVANKEYFDGQKVDYSSKEYEKPYLYSKVGNVSDYYLSKVKDFEADKDANGKTISGSAKKKAIQYINSLNASIPEKAMLIKMYGNFTFNNYNKEIIEYVNSKRISKTDKEALLKKLDFKIQNGRVYY